MRTFFPSLVYTHSEKISGVCWKIKKRFPGFKCGNAVDFYRRRASQFFVAANGLGSIYLPKVGRGEKINCRKKKKENKNSLFINHILVIYYHSVAGGAETV